MNRVLGVCANPLSTSRIWYEPAGPGVMRVRSEDGTVVERTALNLYPRLHDPGQYTFVVYDNTALTREGDKGGFIIILRQEHTGKTKQFFQAVGSIENLISHMNSLTDDLCSQWFNERPPKIKKK